MNAQNRVEQSHTSECTARSIRAQLSRHMNMDEFYEQNRNNTMYTIIFICRGWKFWWLSHCLWKAKNPVQECQSRICVFFIIISFNWNYQYCISCRCRGIKKNFAWKQHTHTHTPDNEYDCLFSSHEMPIDAPISTNDSMFRREHCRFRVWVLIYKTETVIGLEMSFGQNVSRNGIFSVISIFRSETNFHFIFSAMRMIMAFCKFELQQIKFSLFGLPKEIDTSNWMKFDF